MDSQHGIWEHHAVQIKKKGNQLNPQLFIFSSNPSDKLFGVVRMRMMKDLGSDFKITMLE